MFQGHLQSHGYWGEISVEFVVSDGTAPAKINSNTDDNLEAEQDRDGQLFLTDLEKPDTKQASDDYINLTMTDWLDLYDNELIGSMSKMAKTKDDVKIDILSSSQNFIDTKLKFQQVESFITFIRLRGKEEIRNLVSDAWRARESGTLLAKFNRCSRELISWTKEQIQLKVQAIKNDQEALESALSALVPDNDLISVLTASLDAAYVEEESLWRQRSRILRLQERDKNTSFFHAVTRRRKAMNHFSVIEDDDGLELFEEKQIAASVSAFYEKLFTSTSSRQFEVVEEAIQPQITDYMNTKLTAMPNEKEIHDAVLDNHADKAPGPDGFSAGFYHSFWEIIGKEVSREILVSYHEYAYSCY
ncbi:hypothetical protein ISN44_As11g032100 [Arabidopsis suecica]|uniref:Uncharacterized protein n=1 Tax=Arabidopsis suecica TaxID=45249 RepID=A0A8T1ZGC8_ARASU|nr:hypothetical protein ISN44_As11g032100 [Arabidopsis suecica]